MQDDIAQLPTEAVNRRTSDISNVSTLEALRLINAEDQQVAPAVRSVLPEVADAVEAIAARLRNGGRLFYIGAGTSGRLGVVDASECPPTFGTPPEMVQGIIAGGRAAMFIAQEGAEDVSQNGARDLQDVGLAAADAVMGIAASGRTPYVIGALQYARSVGALTIGLTVNVQAILREHTDIFIAPEVGPEAIAGSTRMKAGTAQKLVLNMISTGVMLRLGRVQGNRMTDLRPLCAKLVRRAENLVMEVAQVDLHSARLALQRADGNARLAIEVLQEKKG